MISGEAVLEHDEGAVLPAAVAAAAAAIAVVAAHSLQKGQGKQGL